MRAKNIAWYAIGIDGQPIGIGEDPKLAIEDAVRRGLHEPDWDAPTCFAIKTPEGVRGVRKFLDGEAA